MLTYFGAFCTSGRVTISPFGFPQLVPLKKKFLKPEANTHLSPSTNFVLLKEPLFPFESDILQLIKEVGSILENIRTKKKSNTSSKMVDPFENLMTD